DEVHRSHFAARASEHTGRPTERYLDRFDDIRRVQRYIKSQALSHGVPVIANYSFDRALAAIIDLVMERAAERTAPARVRASDETERGRAPAPVAGAHGGGRRGEQTLAEVEGPISIETTELEPEAMYGQGLDLAQMAPNAVVKVPMTPEG